MFASCVPTPVPPRLSARLQSDELLVVEAGVPVEGGTVAFMDLGPSPDPNHALCRIAASCMQRLALTGPVSPGVEIRIADMESGRVCLPERQV
jgi:hypothetical protein